MRIKAKWCGECGAKMVEYRHSLTRPLVVCLSKLYFKARRSPMNLKEMPELSYNERCNFQKLRYFELVENPARNGIWRVTAHGERFLFGEAKSQRVAVTYRGVKVAFEGAAVTCEGVTGLYLSREEWALNARPHEPRPS